MSVQKQAAVALLKVAAAIGLVGIVLWIAIWAAGPNDSVVASATEAQSVAATEKPKVSYTLYSVVEVEGVDVREGSGYMICPGDLKDQKQRWKDFKIVDRIYDSEVLTLGQGTTIFIEKGEFKEDTTVAIQISYEAPVSQWYDHNPAALNVYENNQVELAWLTNGNRVSHEVRLRSLPNRNQLLGNIDKWK